MFTAQATAVKTTVEYSEVSTLHGLKYIFEDGNDLSISKVLWFLVVLGATGFGIIWSYEEGSILNYLSDILKSYYPTKDDMERDRKFHIMRFLCQVYEDWQANPTVNYLKTTGLPLSDIDFPSITICSQGSIYEVNIFLIIPK